MQEAEVVYLNENGVLVTDRRIVTPWRTYAVQHVASAWQGEDGRRRGGPIWGLFAGALCMGAVGTMSIAEITPPAGLLVFLVMEAIAGCLGGVFLVSVARSALRRPRPCVWLDVDGRELMAYSDPDQVFVRRVVRAIQQAISHA